MNSKNSLKIVIPGILVLLLIIIFVFIFFIKIINSHNDEMNPDALIEDEIEVDLTDEEILKDKYTPIGKRLYLKATQIVQIKPYCGKSYKEISDKDIIIENNVRYYKTNYQKIDQINAEIAKYLFNKPTGNITGYIERNGKIYCKYVSPINTKKYVGLFSINYVSSTNNEVVFDVTTEHIASKHSDVCTIDDYINCSNEDLITQKSRFVIANVNGSWKIKEFLNPYN